MGAITIDENIRVGVAFDSGRLIPMWFRWKNRYYKVKTVNFNWSSIHGSGRVRHYSVSDGANVYELCFNARTLEWRLGRISVD